MKLTTQTFEYDGAPNGTRKEMHWHLVSSAYLFEDPILKIVINHDADLMCCGSDPSSISFSFSEDQEWQGWYETTVTITGETAEEIEKLKLNQFRQTAKGQMVVAFLPWTDPNDEAIIASWEAEESAVVE